MNKKRVLILLGGKSGEHEISIISATSVFKSLDRNKYDVSLVGIDKTGKWFVPDEKALLSQSSNPKKVQMIPTKNKVCLLPFENKGELMSVGEHKTSSASLHGFDVVFPVLHGPHGEDGTLQGLLQLSGLPFVGSGVLGSALCMDKDVAKRVLRDAGIPVVPFIAIKRSEFKKNPAHFLMKAKNEHCCVPP